MATLIAQHTIHGQRRIHTADPTKPNDHDRYELAVLSPGMEFDPAKIGISEDEAKSLIAEGAVRQLGSLELPAADPATDVARHPPEGGGELDELPSYEELAAMTRAQLEALAAARGVDVSQAKNKADVITALVDAEDVA